MRGWGETKARVERAAGSRQQATDTGQIYGVVGVPAIGGATPRGYEAAIAKFAQVVRDQVLTLSDQGGQLVNRAVAPRQLGQEVPAQGMAGQLQELRRGDVVELLGTHTQEFTSILLDTSI